MKTLFLLVICVLAINSPADELSRREWEINGVTREALVHLPKVTKRNLLPVIFAFHGHGGSMKRAARMFAYETIWPEAIVVYMQGLNTPGQLTDPEGKKPGWQKSVGDQNDRDLEFFDSVLASLIKEHKVDRKRIFATGHSNGGGFTYLLWEARADMFAAFAPSASLGRTLVETNPLFALELSNRRAVNTNETSTAKTNSISSKREFTPKPVFHVAGTNDPLVKFAWQKLMIDAVRKLNQCVEGKPWVSETNCVIYESKVNAPVVTYITPGTHAFPKEAPALIVKFFKQQALAVAR